MKTRSLARKDATQAQSRTRSNRVPIRHGRLGHTHTLASIARIAGALVLVIVVSSGSVTALALWHSLSSMQPVVHLATLPRIAHAVPVGAEAPGVGEIEGGVNLLLTGSDSRTGQAGFQTRQELVGSSGAGNNDVTMVLHISQDHSSATVVSIPRDLMVAVPACPRPKGGTTLATSRAMFNSTYSRGGLSCVVLAAEKLLGIDITYAAEISFDGVVALSNAVGGVTVCLATALRDPYVGLNLAAGNPTLQGAQALAFVRSRHGVGDGSDLGRISNQQLFMSALLRKLTSAGVLSNPITLFTIANVALKNMRLSDTLANPSTMVSIALSLKSVRLDRVVFLQYPSTGDPTESGRVIPEPVGASLLARALAADKPVVLTGAFGRAAVSGSAPVAAAVTPVASSTASSVAPSAAAGAVANATPAPIPTIDVSLPKSVTGQTAAQQTCTKGN